MQKEKLYIVIPAYNEEDSVATIIHDYHSIIEKTGADGKLVIINDGSKDKTAEITGALKKKFPGLEMLTKANSGHGPSCLFGYNYAIEQGATHIFQTDCDGQTHPGDFWKLWEKRNDASFVFGLRKERRDGPLRSMVSWVLGKIIYMVFGVNIKDANVPFRLMNAQRLKPVLAMIPEDFFLANSLIAIIAVKRKEKICWQPIEFNKRAAGVSSISIRKLFKIGLRVIKDLREFRYHYYNPEIKY